VKSSGKLGAFGRRRSAGADGRTPSRWHRELDREQRQDEQKAQTTGKFAP